MTDLIIFLLASTGIAAFSRRSLKNGRSHGFHRFFAFECIVILFLLNRRVWFRDPFATAQVVSWIVLCASLVIAAHGFYLLLAIGKPKGDFENTTKLVTAGAYAYIRHPLYTSLMLLAWGIFLKDIALQGALLVCVVTVFLYATAKVEESENLQTFGDEYAAYIKKTKMFIPTLL
jgi:protein-S-isoprenylcysteine O-methyltransferase Ste14